MSQETATSGRICINCGKSVKELYKKYSPTVLKLTNCNNCDLIADKYIEYEPIIIIIDLVLLSREAYRHVLFNTSFSFYWKLFVVLQLMEAYTEWTLVSPWYYNSDEEIRKRMVLDNFFTADLEYYKMFLKILARSSCFIIIVHLLTLLRSQFTSKKDQYRTVGLLDLFKCITLSSFGIFLFLPSIIWDKSSLQEYHYIFISLYTTLSQLVAYTVVCQCSKFWAIIVINTSYFFKIFCFDVVNMKF